jgi:cyanophycinase
VPGALVLVGGGRIPNLAFDRFIELAGGDKARIVVIPTASSLADEADMEPFLAVWKKARVSAKILHTRSRKEANNPKFAGLLAKATGVWFPGGDQARLAQTYRGTAVEQELRKVLGRGGVIGGAPVVSDLIVGGGPRRATTAKGLGLLPGLVVDQQVLAKDRLNRLQRVLTQNPGYAGIGVDEGTAVVIQGRIIGVLGESYAVVCQAAGAGRPASVQMLRAGKVADLLAVRRSAFQRTQAPFPLKKPNLPVVPRGALVIGGGGKMPLAVYERFVELAGGPNSLIVVVPTSMPDPIPDEAVEAKMLRRAGARNLKVLHTRDRKVADSAAFIAPLKKAKGVWFTGGRQYKLVDAYEGTLTERAFHDLLRRGGVIGGASAGASIQSEYMPRGDPLNNTRITAEGYERGFCFLQGTAVDQHFFARKRQRDMTELLKEYPQYLGIGVDEATAVIIQRSVLEVLGRSKVAIFDTTKSPDKAGKDYEELTTGQRYDLRERRRLNRR